MKKIILINALVFLIVLSACYREEDKNDHIINENTSEMSGNEQKEATYMPKEASENEADRSKTPDVPNEEPIVFCGAADPENAVTLSDEQALSYLVLVNRCYRVSDEFEPADLSPVNVESRRVLEGSHHLLRETAARAAEALFQAAEAEDLFLIASSGYRSYEWQTYFYTNAVDTIGLEEARRVSAVPGHSEHQLGLALDVSTRELEGDLIEAFATTPEGMWVNENAHRFGFIISYPQNREAETGFIYEPWHIRFIGVEAATEIFNHEQILEAFLWYE